MEEYSGRRGKPRDFLKKQGFYVVLFVCLLIVGAAIVLTALPRETEENANAAQQQSAENPVVIETRQSADDTLTAKNTPLPTATLSPAPTLSPTLSPAPTAKPTAAGAGVRKGIAPVKGEIIFGYAAEQLLYSRTLDQWTTHMGVDIAAEAGTPVTAALGGTVEKVYTDDALGCTVTVAHTNGRTSLYANLAEDVPVKAGQKVNAGDALGTVGNTAISECADLPHLHFGFLVDEKSVDPMDYVTLPH